MRLSQDRENPLSKPLLAIFPIGGLYPSEIGGPALVASYLASTLAQTKEIVPFLISTDYDGRTRPPLRDVKAFPVFTNSEGLIAKAYYPCDVRGRSLSSRMFTRSMLEIRKGAVVYVNSLFYAPSILFCYRALRCGAGTIVAPQGELGSWPLGHHPKRKKAALLAWRKIIKANGNVILHAASEEEKQCILRVFGDETKVRLLPNALIELPERIEMAKARNSLGISSEKRVLLSLGRVSRVKNLESLLQAFHLLLQQKAADELWVVGDEDGAGYLNELKSLAGSLNIKNAVIFRPHTTGNTKQQLYAMADVFCLPSHNENFGMVVVEALSQGCPVVASRGTPWSILEEERCGEWVSKNPSNLADGLLKALNLVRSQGDDLRNRCRKLVERRFLYSSLKSEFLNMFLEAALLSGQGKRQ